MTNTPIKVRFAPSPTGKLHVGNVRTALINYLFARKSGGHFLLRCDDTDPTRSEAHYEEAIRHDLEWLGLNWDSYDKQSNYFDTYNKARQKLIDMGRLYPCYETPEELDIKRKMLISRGLPPVYDRSALKLTEAEKSAYEAEGRKAHWRFKLADAPIEWNDMIRGPVHFEGKNLSDPVLIREDGVPLFTFCTSIDDGTMGITHILRGEDHVSNTAIQVQIMQTLGYDIPTFGHNALIQMSGGKLSKREGGGSIEALREEGIFPLSVASYLATLGTSHAIDLAESMDALADAFDLNTFGRSMATYDPEELQRLNMRLIHELPYSAVQEQLRAEGLSEADEAFWNQVKANLHSVAEAKDWWALTHQPITPVIEDAEFTNTAAQLLPEGEWGEQSWNQLVDALKSETGRKGKQLFMPLRLALTARTDGPELPKVIALLGRDRTEKRLRGEAA